MLHSSPVRQDKTLEEQTFQELRRLAALETSRASDEESETDQETEESRMAAGLTTDEVNTITEVEELWRLLRVSLNLQRGGREGVLLRQDPPPLKDCEDYSV